MFSLFNFSSIFPGGSADPICTYVRTPMFTASAPPGSENPSHATGISGNLHAITVHR